MRTDMETMYIFTRVTHATLLPLPFSAGAGFQREPVTSRFSCCGPAFSLNPQEAILRIDEPVTLPLLAVL